MLLTTMTVNLCLVAVAALAGRSTTAGFKTIQMPARRQMSMCKEAITLKDIVMALHEPDCLDTWLCLTERTLALQGKGKQGVAGRPPHKVVPSTAYLQLFLLPIMPSHCFSHSRFTAL